mmetsp:Transcript_33546/g.88924  ORF Transcript_33546/g.88924 Transcript_33546/m.88924 type:complete len:97 (-) Transcript_33546:138-428(-)
MGSTTSVDARSDDVARGPAVMRASAEAARNVKLPTNATAAENPDITLIRKLSASPLPRSASYACNKQGPCQRRFQSQAAPTRMFIDYGNFPFDEIL